MDRLAVFSALGDKTRYAIYHEVLDSAEPLSTTEVADRLELHPNTVRAHLERMRDVGLLELKADSRGSVGRPQHRWSAVELATALALDPSALRLLAGLLAELASSAGVQPGQVVAVGRAGGRLASGPTPPTGSSCLEQLLAQLAELGFDPVVAGGGRRPVGTTDPGEGGADLTRVGFGQCPFRELAEVFPELVCELHRAFIEGLVGGGPDAGLIVSSFSTVVDDEPCRMELVVR